MFEMLFAAALLNAFGGATSTSKPKRSNMFLRAFNAFQVVTLFAALPYLIGWLYTAPFPFSVAAFGTALVVYGVLFIWHVISVAHNLGE